MHHVGFVVFPGFQLLGLSAVTAFEVANAVIKRKAYQIDLISEEGGAVPCSAGFSIDTYPFGRTAYDTVMIGSGIEPPQASSRLSRFVCQAWETGSRVAAPCTGAFVLAQAGLLDDRKATTHWLYASELQKQFPRTSVQLDSIFVADGQIWTSAGMAAAIDLALALIQADFGLEVSQDVARKLVVYHRRGGGQSQFSVMLDLVPKTDRIQKCIEHANANLRETLSVEDLAQVAGLSPRQFSRAFRSETGQSPAKAIEHLRVEAARRLLEEGLLALDDIANEVGFGDRERMRRSCLRSFGQPPQAIRRLGRASV